MYKIIFSNYDDRKNPYYGGGGALAVHEVAKRLAADFDVVVVTGRYPNSVDEIVDNVKYRRIGTSMFGPKVGQFIFLLLLPLYAKYQEFDLWIESFTPPFSTSFLPLFIRQPVIGLAHTLAGKDASRKYLLPFHLVERLGLKAYKQVIAVSDFVKEEVLRANPRAQVRTVYNGIGLPKNKRHGDGKYILFLGRIEVDQKGLDLLLDAYKQISDIINLPLLVAGSGAKGEEKRLKAQVFALGLDKKAFVVGKANAEKKARLFKGAAFTVVPSRFETFSLTALESLSFGVPVLAFDIKGLSWLPASVAVKAVPFQEDDLAKGMLKLAIDDSLRQQMGARGRELAGQYSWDRSAKEYKEFILSVIRKYGLKDKTTQSLQPKTALGPAQGQRQMAETVSQIIKEKLPCYFISPHLDDAALSATDLMVHLAGKTQLTVVTVFSQAGPRPYSLSAKKFLKLHGYEDAEAMYEDRRREDRSFYRGLGIKIGHLGFIDALWRKKHRQRTAFRFLGKIFPEFSCLYPTYKFHITSGRLHRQDWELKNDIVNSLRRLIPVSQRYVIFCPAGFGGHIDHILTRQACEGLSAESGEYKQGQVIYWKDATYELKAEDQKNLQGRAGSLWQNDAQKKYALLYTYQSQIPQMFAVGKKPEEFETYYI